MQALQQQLGLRPVAASAGAARRSGGAAAAAASSAAAAAQRQQRQQRQQQQQRSKRAAVVARHAASSESAAAAVELPPHLAAELDELERSNACGSEGTVLVRPIKEGVPKNGRRYHIHTFGCQMNLADSERMAGALEAAGYDCAPDAADADVLIYNTCSIREKAEVKVYSALGKQAKRKRARMGDVKIVVAGCVAQQEGETLLRRVPEVDLVMGEPRLGWGAWRGGGEGRV